MNTHTHSTPGPSADAVDTATLGPPTYAERGTFLIQRQLRKISHIGCLDELDGYETEARKRGVHPEEMKPLQEKRISLTPKKRNRR